MTIEKIFEIRDELVKQGIIDKPKIDDSTFLKLFEELKEWFKWDIRRFPYKELVDPIGYRYDYKDRDLMFYNENYDLIVFSAMVGIYICTITDNLETTRANHRMSELFSVYCDVSVMEFYRNYKKICSIDKNVNNLAFFIKGMIRNRMGNNTFEEFLISYTTILQKYKTMPSVNDNSAIETTVVDVPVAPTYQISHRNPNQDIVDKYGYVPAAVEALKYKPFGFYYQYNGSYYSSFVDYSSFKNIDVDIQKYYNDHILKLMSNVKEVYECILEYMPIIGTRFTGKDPVLLRFIGASKNQNYLGRFVIGCKLDRSNYVQGCKKDQINTAIIFCCNAIDNSLKTNVYFGGIEGVNKKINEYLNDGVEMTV